MIDSIDVVALGELLIDFVDRETGANGNHVYEAAPGGAPCNVLAMLRKFGHTTAFIGKVGDDFFGQSLKACLCELGINIEGLLLDKRYHTTLAFIHKKEDGDRTFSFYRNPGADMMLTEDEVNLKIIKSGRIFHFGTLSMTADGTFAATKKALYEAEAAGLIRSFDPNIRASLWDSMDRAKEMMSFGMENCDVLKISDDEIEFFTGEKDIIKGIEIIKSKYNIKLICATMGKDGSMAFYKGMALKGEPVPNPATIETTGAGDTFMGVVLHYVLKNDIDKMTKELIAEMLACANKAASIITGRNGALKVMPEEKELIPQVWS